MGRRHARRSKLKTRDAIKLLRKAGFYKSPGKGSRNSGDHETWEHEDGRRITLQRGSWDRQGIHHSTHKCLQDWGLIDASA